MTVIIGEMCEQGAYYSWKILNDKVCLKVCVMSANNVRIIHIFHDPKLYVYAASENIHRHNIK